MTCRTNRFTLTAILALGLAANAFALDEPDYNLVFNPATGGLTLTGIDRGLVLYDLRSDNDAFLESADPDDRRNHRLVVSTVEFVPGVFIQFGGSFSTPGSINEAYQFANDFPSPGENRFIGNLLPADLAQGQVEDAISRARYVNQLGEPNREFNLVYLPEPGSLALLGIGGLALLRRRRER